MPEYIDGGQFLQVGNVLHFVKQKIDYAVREAGGWK